MDEKIIRIAVPIIPTIIIIACVAAAFATHDWDVQATLLGDQPSKVLEKLSPAGLTSEEELFEVTDFKLSEEGTKLLLEAVFHSPLNLSVTIKEMQAECILDGSIGTIHLPSEVTVPARGSASLRLEGPLPAGGDPLMYPLAENPIVRRMMMKVDVGGIIVTLEEIGEGGGR